MAWWVKKLPQQPRTLSRQSAPQVAKTRGWKGFHSTVYTVMPCAGYECRNLDVYAVEHLCTTPSSVPTRKRCGWCGLNATHDPEARLNTAATPGTAVFDGGLASRIRS